MIVAGDVAVGPGERFVFSGFPGKVANTPWCVNLEGAPIDQDELPAWGVVNCARWADSFADFSLGPVFIGNNHIQDVDQGIELARKSISSLGVDCFGAGGNVDEARKVAQFVSEGLLYGFLGFGWDVVGCRPALEALPGVNQFEGRAVLRQVEQALRLGLDRVVVVIHGNYEFEVYPQPGHRKLSRELIDAGVYAVIFHHPHVVGPIERYKGRTIAYSLGNWAFSYGAFFDRKLRFPESSFRQIALELGRSGDLVHHASFTPPNLVEYSRTEIVASSSLSIAAVFEEFSDSEYLAWFKKNRKKRKLLPIYLDADDSFSNSMRDRWVAARQVLVELAAKHGLKAMRKGA